MIITNNYDRKDSQNVLSVLVQENRSHLILNFLYSFTK